MAVVYVLKAKAQGHIINTAILRINKPTKLLIIGRLNWELTSPPYPDFRFFFLLQSYRDCTESCALHTVCAMSYNAHACSAYIILIAGKPPTTTRRSSTKANAAQSWKPICKWDVYVLLNLLMC